MVFSLLSCRWAEGEGVCSRGGVHRSSGIWTTKRNGLQFGRITPQASKMLTSQCQRHWRLLWQLLHQHKLHGPGQSVYAANCSKKWSFPYLWHIGRMQLCSQYVLACIKKLNKSRWQTPVASGSVRSSWKGNAILDMQLVQVMYIH